jgi:hypothetical protein
MRVAVAGALLHSRLSAVSNSAVSLRSRTGLPVVSNRAFVAAWMSRRNQIVAAARVARAN